MIYQGDYKELLGMLPPRSVDLVVTDPPYWHHKSPGKPYSQRSQCSTKSKFSTSTLYNADCSMMKEMSDFDGGCIEEFLDLTIPKLKIPNMYIFCSESQVPYYCMYADNHRLMFSILVWEKPLSIINKNRFSQNIEYIVRIYDYGTALNKLSDNLLYNRVKKTKPLTGKTKLHPCEKPVELLEQFILLSSKSKALILDPFMGSGSTGVASIKNDRYFIGFEKDVNTFEVARNRLNTYTLLW